MEDVSFEDGGRGYKPRNARKRSLEAVKEKDILLRASRRVTTHSHPSSLELYGSLRRLILDF